jgi:nickel superoxide dismutase
MFLSRFIKPVYAHCDIPCGIYETDSLKHAAETCHRMIQKIEEIGDVGTPENRNNFVRCVGNKERHAQKFKNEVYILWSDYFKPEHLEKLPELHDTLWRAVKQASKVKQTVSMEEADKLVALAGEVDELFKRSKQ